MTDPIVSLQQVPKELVRISDPVPVLTVMKTFLLPFEKGGQ